MPQEPDYFDTIPPLDDVWRFGELAAGPWANGAGVTRVVSSSPVDGGQVDFDWRISIADVTSASEFSFFPGVDRLLVLIDGAGLDLIIDGEPHHCEPFCPVTFAGESLTSCLTPSGATRDLNIMVRRGRYRATVVMHSDIAEVQFKPGENEVLFLAILEGNWHTKGAHKVALGLYDCARIRKKLTLNGHGRIAQIGLHLADSIDSKGISVDI